MDVRWSRENAILTNLTIVIYDSRAHCEVLNHVDKHGQDLEMNIFSNSRVLLWLGEDFFLKHSKWLGLVNP